MKSFFYKYSIFIILTIILISNIFMTLYNITTPPVDEDNLKYTLAGVCLSITGIFLFIDRIRTKRHGR